MNCDNDIFSGEPVAKIEQALVDLVAFEPAGIPCDQLLGIIRTNLLPHLMRYDRPGFQSHFNYTVENAAKEAAALVLDYNQNITNWQVSPGGSTLEAMSCRALCRLFDMDPKADATFMYSGTYANQEAIYLALRRFALLRNIPLLEKGLQSYRGPRLLVVASPEFHRLSLIHAVRMLGLGEDSIVYARLDDRLRIDVPALRELLHSEPKDAEFFCVLSNAGTTQTGAIDPIRTIAELCREMGVWLHVDGAYGFAYRLVPEFKELFSGVELADSVSWDPHKQLSVPIPTSMLFLRRREEFASMAVHGCYFNELSSIGHNPGLKSPPTSRPMSALPLVMSLRCLGLAKVAERLRAPIEAVRECARRLGNENDIRVVVEPDLGILCLRLVRTDLKPEEADEVHQEIQLRITSRGKRSISKARVGGNCVLRLVAVSPDITANDLMDTIEAIRHTADEIIAERAERNVRTGEIRNDGF